MRLRSTLAAIGSVFALASVFLLGMPSSAEAAFNACACSCVNNEATTALLRPVVAGQTCLQAYGSGSACTAPSVFVNASLHTYPSLGDRCVIECADLSTRTEWIALSPNKTDCRDDCTEACEGGANLDPTQNQSQNLYRVPCLRDDQCAIGAFSKYDDVRCQYTELGPQDDGYDYWPNHIRPQCVIPPTLQNADTECREYGGAARGGLCIRIPSGTSPAGYYITRPYVDASGAYAADTFDETDLSRLNAQLDSWNGEPGLCMLYGLAEGVEFDIEEEIPIGINIGEGTVDVGPIGTVSGSSRYICAKRKSNTCGSVAPTGSLATNVRSASQFRCVVPEFQGITNPSSYCFSEQQSAELCVNDPGTRCCAADVASGCRDDLDCVPPKTCEDIDAATGFGRCEFDPVCDSQHTDRRCRSASASEKVNPNICSAPLSVLESFGTRCPNPAQACCNNGTPRAIGTCASDMAVPGKDWGNYTCVNPSDIPDSQFVTDIRGTRSLIEWDDSNGHCLPNTVPAGGRAGAPLERCTGSKVCCDLTEMVATDYNQYLVSGRNSMTAGAACPGGLSAAARADVGAENFACRSSADITDALAQDHGYRDRNQFLLVASQSPYCIMTPLAAGQYFNTRECANGYICCSPNFDPDALCDIDADCGDGETCDKSLSLCVPSTEYDAARELGGDNCYVRASQAGDTSGADLIGSTLDDGSEATAQSFTCQIVDVSSNASLTRCLQRGCENVAGAIPDGYARRCCLPGVGVAPTAAAGEEISGRAENIPTGAFTIGLPACIRTGQCGLDDIVATGANFANFLIGLSGSVFLAIFVYAGFLYLTAGTSDRVGRAKKMIIQSSIAMVLILGAFVFVRFIQQSFIAAATDSEAPTCGTTEDTKNFSCTLLNVDANDEAAIAAEVNEKACVRGLCPGAKNYVCCPAAEEE